MPTSIPPFNNVPAPNDPVQSAWATQITQYAVDHVNDTVDAHDASAISFVPTGSIAATNVQAAIVEAAGEGLQAGSPAGGVLAGTYPNPGFAVDMATQVELDSVQSALQSGVNTNTNNLNAHLNDTDDAHDASAISFTPSGSIAATNVQDAIAEVAAEASGGGSGMMTLVGQTADPVPIANTVLLFAKKIGNSVLPMMRSPFTNRRAIMPLAGWHHSEWSPYTDAAMANSAVGGAPMAARQNTGTATVAIPASGSRFNRTMRLEVLTASAFGAVAGWDTGIQHCWMGNAGEGGFIMSLRWGPATGVSNGGMRAMAGICYPVGGDVQPSTLYNIAAMAWDSADANIQMMFNDASGTADKVDLGASFPVPGADRQKFYELILIAPPAGGELNWLVTDLTTGAEVQGVATSNLPSSTQMNKPAVTASTGGTTNPVGIAVMGCDLWTPY